MEDSSGIIIWACKGRALEEVCAGSYVMDKVVCLSYKLYFLDLRKLLVPDFVFFACNYLVYLKRKAHANFGRRKIPMLVARTI